MAKHEDVGTCTECKSDQPDEYTIKQLKMGWDSFPCKFCGGVCIVVLKENRKTALKQVDRQRGLI